VAAEEPGSVGEVLLIVGGSGHVQLLMVVRLQDAVRSGVVRWQTRRR